MPRAEGGLPLRFIRARSPLRVSFVGGGTDLPSYYSKYGGAILASTINRYAWVTLAPRDDALISISSLDYDVSVKYHLDEEPIVADALRLAQATVKRAVAEAGQGLDIFIQSDAPAGSGLGGSAALVLAVLGAVMRWKGVTMDLRDLAELASTIERQDLGINGGKQDQYEIATGGFNLIEFADSGIQVATLQVPSHVLNDLEHHLMICYTGQTKTSAHITANLEDYILRGRPETIQALQELTSLVYDMKRALVQGQLREMAAILDLAWALKLRYNPPEVTTPVIDAMYAEAKGAGALGGKLLGSGGGGFLLLFCESNRKRAVRERLERMGAQFAPFSFVQQGMESWWSSAL